MKKTRNLKKAAEIGFALTTLAVLVAGCGGGSTAVAPAATAPSGLTGSIVKGPVGAARVYANTQNDVDCNAAIANPLNPSVLTNASGVFTFPAASAVAGTGYLICATGGSDSITGADLTGTVLTAPPTLNAPVVTPFTTLVVGQLQASGVNLNTATTAQVNAAVAPLAAATGLPASAIVPATSADAVTVETQANVVQTLLTSTAKLVAAAAASGTQSTDVYSAAIRGVTAAVAANAGGNLTANLNSNLANAAVLNTINQASAPAAVKALDAVTVASAVAPGLANAAAAVGSSANNSMLTASVLAQNAAVTNLTNLLAGLSSKLTASWMNVIRFNPANSVNSYDSVVASLRNAANAYLVATPNASGVTSTTAYQSGVTAGNAALNALNDAAGAGTYASAVAAGQTPASAAAAAGTLLGVAVNASGVPTASAVVASNTLQLSSPGVTASGVRAAVTTTAAPYSVTVAGQLQSADVMVTVDGNVTLPTTPVGAMVSVADVNGPRRLILSIDQVNVTKDVNNVVSVTVPATAKLYALGVNAAGTPFAAVLVNAAQNVFSSTNGVVSINWAGTALQTALTQANAGFTNALTAKGTFQVQVGIQGIKMTKVDNPANKAATTAPADVITGSLTNLSAAAQAAAAQAGFVSTSFSGFGTTIMVTAN